MPRILVSDTNIWVDFHRAGLLNVLFSLPYEFCTTDFVKAELIAPEVRRLISLGLKVHDFNGEEIIRLGVLMQTLNYSSLADVSCFFLADKLQCLLLTGERGPIFWTGKLMLIYQLVRRVHETHTPPYFHGRI